METLALDEITNHLEKYELIKGIRIISGVKVMSDKPGGIFGDKTEGI